MPPTGLLDLISNSALPLGRLEGVSEDELITSNSKAEPRSNVDQNQKHIMRQRRKGNSIQPSSHPPERGRGWDNGFDNERDTGHSGRPSMAQSSTFKPVPSSSSQTPSLSTLKFRKNQSASDRTVTPFSSNGHRPSAIGSDLIFKNALTSAVNSQVDPGSLKQRTTKNIRGLANQSKGKGKANEYTPIDLTRDVEGKAPANRDVEEEIEMFSDDYHSSQNSHLNAHRPRHHGSFGGDSDDPMGLRVKPPKEHTMKRKDGTVQGPNSFSNLNPKPKPKAPKAPNEAEPSFTVRLRTVQFNKRSYSTQSGGIFCLNLSDTAPHCSLKLFATHLKLELELPPTLTIKIEASDVLQTCCRWTSTYDLAIKVTPGFHFRQEVKDWQNLWTDPPEHLRGRESSNENIFLFEFAPSSTTKTLKEMHQIIDQWLSDPAMRSSADLWDTFPLPPPVSDHCDDQHRHLKDKPRSSSEQSRRQDPFPHEGALNFEVSTSTYRGSVSRQNRVQALQLTPNDSPKDSRTFALELLEQEGTKLLDRTAAPKETEKRQQLLNPNPSGIGSSRHPVQPDDASSVDDLSTPKRMGSSRPPLRPRDTALPHNASIPNNSLAPCSSSSSRYITRNSRAAEEPPRSPVEGLSAHKPRAPSNGSCDSDIALVWPFDDERTLSSVAITNGDMKRLEEGEFLNDTLIEFGLKWELSEIRRTNINLADSIHLFNSFFYQKLTKKSRPQKCNLTEEAKSAYEGVRKWTKGLDVFKKDFLVIPINENMHWYFMIVANPGRALDLPSEMPSSDSQSPCITKRLLRSRKSDSGVSDKRGSATPEPEPEQTATKSRFFAEDHDNGKEDIEMDERTEAAAEEPGEPSNMVDKSTEAMQHMELDDDQGAGVGVVPAPNELNDINLPYILTLDSLGTSHRPQSQTVLRYLANEAEDKLSKTLPEPLLFKAVSVKKVPVPEQPNFCDCGLYLIHAFKTFFHDRTRMLRWILDNHKRRPNELLQAEISHIWDANGAAQARKALRDRINILIPQYQERAKQQKALTAERKRENANTRKLSATALADAQEPTKKRRLSHNDCPALTDLTSKANVSNAGPIPSCELRATASNSPCLVEDGGAPTPVEATSVTLHPRTPVVSGRQMGYTVGFLDDSDRIPGLTETSKRHSRPASVEGVGTPEEESSLDLLQHEDMHRMLNCSVPVPITCSGTSTTTQLEVAVQSSDRIGSRAQNAQHIALTCDDLSSPPPSLLNGESCEPSRKGVNGDVLDDIPSDVDGEPMEQDDDVQELSIEEQTQPVRTPIEILTPQAQLRSPKPICKEKTRCETSAARAYASVTQPRPASTSKAKRHSGRPALAGQTSSDSRTDLKVKLKRPTEKRRIPGTGDQDNPLTVDDD